MNFTFLSIMPLIKRYRGFNPLDFDGAQLQMGNFVPNQTIDLEMKQFDIEVGFSF